MNLSTCFSVVLERLEKICSYSVFASLSITVSARAKAGIVGSIPTQGMDICVRLFYVYVVLCAGSGLPMG
jgi:hypothetical protein